jgi:hypothetical protein
MGRFMPDGKRAAAFAGSNAEQCSALRKWLISSILLVQKRKKAGVRSGMCRNVPETIKMKIRIKLKKGTNQRKWLISSVCAGAFQMSGWRQVAGRLEFQIEYLKFQTRKAAARFSRADNAR